jgi:hypothetical protein
MLNHKLTATICAGVALLVSAGAAQAANFSATVSPAAAGTTQSPQPHTTGLALTKIDPGIDGNAKSALVTLVESLPADFVTTLAPFATCPPSTVVHGDNKPKCPDAALLGHVTATAYLPALAFNTTSDQGYIWKIGDNRVGVWVHVSHPIPAGIAAYGTVTRGVAPFGPVVTWDMRPLADGAQAGSEIRVNDIAFTWEQRGASPPSSTGTSSGSASRQLKACRAKARRIKNARKRRAALNRCAKAYQKAKRPSNPAAPAPFVSTGCTSGKWPFRAQMTFFDNTTETDNASVGCTPTGGSTPANQPSSPAPGPTSPLCPPVCGVSDAGAGPLARSSNY